MLSCFIDPRVRKIRNEVSSCPGIFSRTLRFYYVANSPGSHLSHLLDGHRKLVGCSGIPARSCPGPVRYYRGSIVELEVSPDETPGLKTLHPYNTNVLQSITWNSHMYVSFIGLRWTKTNLTLINRTLPPCQHWPACNSPVPRHWEPGPDRCPQRACASVFISVETMTVFRTVQWINDQIRHDFVLEWLTRQTFFRGNWTITIKIIYRFQWKLVH